MYDEWYHFAQEHSCLIDDYDQISRDFEPFYQLARDDPSYFGKMVATGSVKVRATHKARSFMSLMGWTQVKKDGNGMKTGMFSGGKFSFTDEQGTLYTGDWPRTFERVRAS